MVHYAPNTIEKKTKLTNKAKQRKATRIQSKSMNLMNFISHQTFIYIANDDHNLHDLKIQN